VKKDTLSYPTVDVATACSAGRVKLKHEPVPGFDSAHIRPPILSMMRLQVG
jgi:hypothetical protein